MLDLIQRAFAGETVTIPAFWYDPRDVARVHVAEGRRVAIEITAFPLRGRDGRVSHVAMVHKDVTADLLAQAERTALTARLEMILDRMPIGCILNDAEFRFAYWTGRPNGSSATRSTKCAASIRSASSRPHPCSRWSKGSSGNWSPDAARWMRRPRT